MPTFHGDIALQVRTAVPISNGSVTAARVHNPSGYTVILQATASNVAPTSTAGGLPLLPNDTLAADLSLANLFPGVGAGPFFLWAFSDTNCTVSVSHA